MKKTNQISSIKKHLSNGQIDKAIQLMIESKIGDINTNRSELELLKSQYKRVEKEALLGLRDSANDKNRITYALIKILNSEELIELAKDKPLRKWWIYSFLTIVFSALILISAYHLSSKEITFSKLEFNVFGKKHIDLVFKSKVFEITDTFKIDVNYQVGDLKKQLINNFDLNKLIIEEYQKNSWLTTEDYSSIEGIEFFLKINGRKTEAENLTISEAGIKPFDIITISGKIILRELTLSGWNDEIIFE